MTNEEKMTPEEAIAEISFLKVAVNKVMEQALEMAIQALSQEPTEKPMCDRNICISNEYNGIGCDECVVNKEQEPCDDVISREAVKELIKCGVSTDTYDDVEQVCKWIDALPSVTQKSGKWIYRREDKYSCSKCGTTTRVDESGIDEKPMYKFCPYCGAAMFEPQESEDK